MGTTEKVTLTLPHDLMEAVRTMSSKRGQSKFISEAITYYVEAQQRRILREQLIAGYQATAEESLAVAKEWEPLGFEAWQKYVSPYDDEEPTNDANNS